MSPPNQIEALSVEKMSGAQMTKRVFDQSPEHSMSRLLRILRYWSEDGFRLDIKDAQQIEQQLKVLNLAVPDFIKADAAEEPRRRGRRHKRWKLGQHRELADAKTAYEKKLHEFKAQGVRSPYVAAMEHVEKNFRSGDYPVGKKSWEMIFTKQRGPAED